MYKKKVVSLMLVISFVLSVVMIQMPSVAAWVNAGEMAAFDAVDNDHNVTWVTGSEPGSYPYFDVEVMVTDISSAYAASWSLEYDPAILNYSSFSFGDGFEAAGKLNANYPPTIDYTNGRIKEGNTAHSNPDGGSVKTYTSPTYGLVATITFEFIASTPAIGSPINTLINITNIFPGRTSEWWNLTGSTPDNGAFQTYTSCGFFYEAEWGAVASPIADFVFTGGVIYEGQSVLFDGSSPAYSTDGEDGDETVPITEWWWDFGDGNASFMTGTGVVSHTYAVAGAYPVCLKVVAPGIGPNIHPSYFPNSTTTCKPVTISVLAFTGIDVYTEDFRWPWYYTNETGEGPMQNASCFRPQENVDLYAYVYYNDDAVQNKLVKFYIVGPDNPYGQFEFFRTAYSSNGSVWNGTAWMPMPDGVAWLPFRIPWPCDYAQERVFGEWKVCVEVSLPDIKPGEEIIYEDCLYFKVSWGVTIIALRTLNATGDPVSDFKKCETITIEIDLTSCYLDDVDAVIGLAVYDDVGTIVGSVIFMVTDIPGETTYCNPVTTTVSRTLHIPKWAYVGPHAMVYANALTWWPWTPQWAEPWCPEVSAQITISKA
jgi:hypothetical protein